ncbi:MAG: RNA pseudouridine synthase [Leptospiraceae bacterium]|nr:RNA pseudouridine synthase [Leptospiraceae bacterium]MCP5500461.1 RNA pseudouridine synthase [Leptospiraceae bacterium]
MLLYRDEFLLFASKPPGIPVHETKDPNRNNFTSYLQKKYHIPYIRTLNRLDLDTSGIVAFGLSESLNREYDEILKKAEKEYILIVEGLVKEKQFRIESFLKDGNRRVKTVFSGGKKAITEFELLYSDSKKNYSVLRAKLITGRRHQIRIHIFEKGHPILGDRVYTGNTSAGKAYRQLLHAYQLKFKDLQEQVHKVIAPIPEDMISYTNHIEFEKFI